MNQTATNVHEWVLSQRSEPPCMVRPAVSGVDLVGWAHNNRAGIDALVAAHGAVLFRGFDAADTETFSRFIEATSSGWALYREPATPRRALTHNVFTSTEYPADQRIPLHNENSHCTSWPLKIYFACQQPPETGGQTPIADCRRVLETLPEPLVSEFVRRRVKYVRRFDGLFGFKWQTVFDTSDLAQVEQYCRENEMEWRWGPRDVLTVSYVRDPVRRHPKSNEPVWFNHALFFNPISLPDDLREVLLAEYSDDELPYTTYYGDGAPIPPAVLEEIKRAYEVHTRYFDWQRHDLMMADNMLVAHGRTAYTGSRRVIVGLAEPCRLC